MANFLFLHFVNKFNKPVKNMANTKKEYYNNIHQNTVQTLKYPSADAVTLYMPGLKANN